MKLWLQCNQASLPLNLKGIGGLKLLAFVLEHLSLDVVPFYGLNIYILFRLDMP